MDTDKNMPDREWDKAILLFADPATRDQGFEKLVELTRPTLSHYFRLKNLSKQESEDLFQNATLRLFEKKDTIKVTCKESWHALFKKVLSNLNSDHWNSAYTRNNVQMNEAAEAQATSDTDESQNFYDTASNQSYGHAANALWLGGIGVEDDPRLLAAKLLFWDRKDLSIVVELLRELRCKEAEYEPSLIIEWISEERILKHLAFKKLGVCPNTLFQLVLGCNKDQIAQFFEDSRSETEALMFRYCNLLPESSVVSRMKGILSEDEVKAILQKYEKRVPFERRMTWLWHSVQKCDSGARALGVDGVWKRLAVHYDSHKMPHKDFLAWVAPAAQIPGYQMKPKTHHGWICNGRLYDELRNYITSRGGSDV